MKPDCISKSCLGTRSLGSCAFCNIPSVSDSCHERAFALVADTQFRAVWNMNGDVNQIQCDTNTSMWQVMSRKIHLQSESVYSFCSTHLERVCRPHRRHSKRELLIYEQQQQTENQVMKKENDGHTPILKVMLFLRINADVTLLL